MGFLSLSAAQIEWVYPESVVMFVSLLLRADNI